MAEKNKKEQTGEQEQDLSQILQVRRDKLAASRRREGPLPADQVYGLRPRPGDQGPLRRDGGQARHHRRAADV